jgi:CHASE3 domain sensor protein
MNSEQKISGTFLFVLLIAAIWLGSTIHNQNKTIVQLKEVIQDCDSAVTEANQNIDELNSSIEDAQSNAWSDYDSMGYTLDDLQSVDEVSNPCYIPRN